MPRTNVILNNDLSDLSSADVLERLEAGKCGHSAVRRYLGIGSYPLTAKPTAAHV